MPFLPALLLALSCTGKEAGDGTPTPTETTPVCARPADVADAVLLLRHTTQGDPAPACLDAVDLLPDEVQADRCDDAVSLAPPVVLEGALPVEGWQLLLSVEGCTLSAADTAGAAAARIVDDPPGQRDLGYDRSRVHQGEARSLVVPGFMEPVSLPVGEATTVLTVQVEAPDCGTCTLRLREAVLAGNGAAWPLPEVQAEVEICG